MMHKSALLIVVFFLPFASAVQSQVSEPVPHPTRPGRVEPCWQQAGISKSAMQEREAIGRETRSEIEQVCGDSSLTAQQKQQKIREIRRQSKERSDALVSPEQLEALHACQKERAANHPHPPGMHHAGGGGPCGELESRTAPSGPPKATQPEEKTSPEEDSHD